MKKYLNLCVEIEETAQKIYQKLAEKAGIPNELKTVLLELSRDEEDHAMQLRFATRFTEGAALREKVYNLIETRNLLSRAQDLLDKVVNTPIALNQCLDIALELEEDFCKIHLGANCEFTNENIGEMFGALAKDDRLHVEKLKKAYARFRQNP